MDKFDASTLGNFLESAIRGSIWISINDDEQAYMKVLCDELFGRSNFITTVIWQKRTSTDNRVTLGGAHDYIIVYVKTRGVEIVIHVNMLKKGWDVNNLYTIVPLRTAASKILREQMVGRGLRLPYGERTGDRDVDAVMLTAHDRFNDILAEAQKGDSIRGQGRGQAE